MEAMFYPQMSPKDQIKYLKSNKPEIPCCYSKACDFEIDEENITNSIFYPIPFHSGYRINKNGYVVNLVSKCVLPININKSGYPSITILKDNKTRTVTVNIHRLLALTFLDIPDGFTPTELDVNHINGIKHDNAIDNLEWVTRKENCDHAYRTGLRDDNTPIEIKNIETGETKIFYSMGEAGRFFNVTAAAIHWQINNKKKPSPYKGYLLKYLKS